jgi:hypothetical protein
MFLFLHQEALPETLMIDRFVAFDRKRSELRRNRGTCVVKNLPLAPVRPECAKAWRR